MTEQTSDVETRVTMSEMYRAFALKIENDRAGNSRIILVRPHWVARLYLMHRGLGGYR